MKKLVCSVVAASLAVVFAAPTFAEDDKEQKLPPQAQSLLTAVQDLDLSEEQTQKVQQIHKQHAPIFQQHIQTQNAIYTQEQKKNRKQYLQEGKKQELKGQKLQQYVQEKLELTPDQVKKQQHCQMEITKQHSKFKVQLQSVLTEQQWEEIPQKYKGKTKGKEKDKGKVRKEKTKEKVEVLPK